MLELMGSLVVIATLGNTELVALGAQEVREYWVISHRLHNISLVEHFDTIVDLSVDKKNRKIPTLLVYHTYLTMSSLCRKKWEFVGLC